MPLKINKDLYHYVSIEHWKDEEPVVWFLTKEYKKYKCGECGKHGAHKAKEIGISGNKVDISKRFSTDIVCSYCNDKRARYSKDYGFLGETVLDLRNWCLMRKHLALIVSVIDL